MTGAYLVGVVVAGAAGIGASAHAADRLPLELQLTFGDGGGFSCTLAEQSSAAALAIFNTGVVQLACAETREVALANVLGGGDTDDGDTGDTGDTGAGDTGDTGAGDTGAGDTGDSADNTAPPTAPIGYLADGTAVYEDRFGIGTLYMPNVKDATTIVFDFYTPDRYYPGCDESATNTFLCRNNGSLKAGVTYVQRLPANARVAGVDGGTGELRRDHLQYALALSDTLVTHEQLTTNTGSFGPKCYKASLGRFVIGHRSSFECGLTQPKYLAFTPIGAKSSRCGTPGYDCRVRITTFVK
jgi:hypothetical protein